MFKVPFYQEGSMTETMGSIHYHNEGLKVKTVRK